MVLTRSAFFQLLVKTGQTEFLIFCVIKGEEAKDQAELQTNTLHLLSQGFPRWE